MKRVEIVQEDQEVLPEINKGFIKQQPEDPSLSENKQSIDVSSMSRKIDMMYTRTLKQTEIGDALINPSNLGSEEYQQEIPRKSKHSTPQVVSERKSLIDNIEEIDELPSSSRENVQIYPTRT